jgi:hypothetical protein
MSPLAIMTCAANSPQPAWEEGEKVNEVAYCERGSMAENLDVLVWDANENRWAGSVGLCRSYSLKV